MSKRINVILPETTVAVLDRVTKPGKRSRFIDSAVLHYVATQERQNLREQLKAGYLANAADDLATAAEWFPLEEEAWETAERTAPTHPAKPSRRSKHT